MKDLWSAILTGISYDSSTAFRPLPFSLATVKSAVFKKEGQKKPTKPTVKENLRSSAVCKVRSQQAEFKENLRVFLLLVPIAVQNTINAC